MQFPWNRHRDDQQITRDIADLRGLRRRAEAATDRLERFTEQFARAVDALDEERDKPRKPGKPWTQI